MKIVISKSNKQPIYEQIEDEIKRLISVGILKPGQALPGMRSLAKDLRISVITTKRAYNDLESEGFINTITGKGSFVSEKGEEIVLQEKHKQVKEHLYKAVKIAKALEISKKNMIEILNDLCEGD